MNTLILLLVSLFIFLLIYMTVKAMPEWFMGANRMIPNRNIGIEYESDDQKKVRLADEALLGPSFSSY